MVSETGIVTRLEQAGFAAEDVATRSALVARAMATFARQSPDPPEAAWFVPGRIEVFGKHTDYAGGRTLVAAVPRGFAVVSSRRTDGVVTVTDARWRDAVDIDPEDETRRFRGWSNYAAVVARRLATNFPGAQLGARIVIASDLPRAAGVSSSSALVVGLALSLIHHARLELRSDWQAAIGGPMDLAGYLGAVENGLSFGTLEGASGVGTHGGSEDHTAILNARAGLLRAFSYVPVHHVADAALPDDWRFIVMSSGVRADKAGGVRDQYNRASLTTRALAELWRARSGRDEATLAAVLRVPGAREDLERWLEQEGAGGFSGRDLKQRLAHFIAEDARVAAAVEAVTIGDRRAIGDLAAASQRDADQLLGNQIPETRRLVALAGGAGAFAASSFGAGFGGSAWALVRAAESERVADAWSSAYRRAMPDVGTAESFICRPSSPAVALFETGAR